MLLFNYLMSFHYGRIFIINPWVIATIRDGYLNSHVEKETENGEHYPHNYDLG